MSLRTLFLLLAISLVSSGCVYSGDLTPHETHTFVVTQSAPKRVMHKQVAAKRPNRETVVHITYAHKQGVNRQAKGYVATPKAAKVRANKECLTAKRSIKQRKVLCQCRSFDNTASAKPRVASKRHVHR